MATQHNPTAAEQWFAERKARGSRKRRLPAVFAVGFLLAVAAAGVAAWWTTIAALPKAVEANQERMPLDDSGFAPLGVSLEAWDPLSLADIRATFQNAVNQRIADIDRQLANPQLPAVDRMDQLVLRALLNLYEGRPKAAYDDATALRSLVAADAAMSRKSLSTVIFLQGVAGLRRGESENCIHCRGDGACVFPILPTAVHTQPEGSQLAIEHFTEYLQRHPSDRGVQWLLNVAYMTLGRYPADVPDEYLLPLDSFADEPAQSIGKFRDIAHLAGVNRLNQAGGAIMDDFDNDGLLDLAVSSMDTAMPLALYRNQGDGTFQERSEQATVKDQLGGLNLVQTDYNNDGWLDIFIIRGAWFKTPVRPSLLKNNGDGTMTDVTAEAGLMDPVNAILARWADYDNDGHLDLFVGCDHGSHRLYHNLGDGRFEDVAERVGAAGSGNFCRGASWGDFDGDGDSDLFVNYLEGPPQLFRNDGQAGFHDVARELRVVAPTVGFSCWFWDYNNDGWLDIYASSYERTLEDLVCGMRGEKQASQPDRLYENLQGSGFREVSKKVGLASAKAPMGSNFADFDNDGFLDFYLATGEPLYSTLVPNRMFRNVQGQRFAEITVSSRTGHLQKGHGVACGDWDRDGHVDMFVQTGGATPGDVFHNTLFQNPAQDGNSWLNVKLVGQKTNRAAIGARIKAVTAGPAPQTVHRTVDSGSSFGANALEQLIGLGKAERVASLEIHWPTSGTTQVFRDVDVNQAIEITEFKDTVRTIDHKRVPLPE